MTTTRARSGGTSERSAASRVRSQPIRVWCEASVTVCVTEDPPQFVKFTFGRETMAPDNTEGAVAAERQLYEYCEEVVARRVKRLARLVQAAHQ